MRINRSLEVKFKAFLFVYIKLICIFVGEIKNQLAVAFVFTFFRGKLITKK